MNNPLSIAASGIQAGHARLNLAASNVVNFDSLHYRSFEARLATASHGAGVTVAGVREDPRPLEIGASGGRMGGPTSNVDLTDALVELIQAGQMFRANLMFLERVDDLQRETMREIMG